MLKTKQTLDFIFVLIGVVTGFASFLVINAFPLGDLTFSIVSGTTLTVGDFRIHHYIIGVAFFFVGFFIKGKIGSFLLGFGSILLLDDVGDLL